MSNLDPETLAAARIVRVLVENGYKDIKLLPNGLWAATFRFIFTSAIVVGQVRDLCGYEDRWCYATTEDARAALAAWDGRWRPRHDLTPEESGYEPEGWHRHPTSGRRRAGGAEWIAL